MPVEEKLKQVMSSVFGVKASSITPSTTREDIDTWDSFFHLNLIVALEEEFGVEFSDAEVPEMFSYAALLKKVS